MDLLSQVQVREIPLVRMLYDAVSVSLLVTYAVASVESMDCEAMKILDE